MSTFARPWTDAERQAARERVRLVPFELGVPPEWMSVAAGGNVATYIDQMVAERRLKPVAVTQGFVSVVIGGAEIPQALWAHVRPKRFDLLTVRVTPQGGAKGKGILRTVLQIAVAFASFYIPGLPGVTNAVAKALDVGAQAAQMITAASINIAGNMLINALAPIPQQELKQRSQAYAISGSRNAIKPFEPCTMVMGEHRVTPPFAARSYTRIENNKVVFYGLFQWHVGKCQIRDLKIGETPIGDYQQVEVQHRLLGEPYASAITLIPGQVFETPEQTELKQADGWVKRAFPPRCSTLSFDLLWPALYQVDDEGEYISTETELQIQYRKVGTSTWIDVPAAGNSGVMDVDGHIEVEAETVDEIRRTVVWSPPGGAGNWEMQIRRLTEDSGNPQEIDMVYLTSLRGERAGAPVLNDLLCLTALKITATNQLNGTIENFNAIVGALIPERDGAGNWTLETVSQNPAAQLRWLHTGPAIAPLKRMLPSQFDGSLEAFHDHCAARGLTCNLLVDYGPSVEDLAQVIASCGNGHIGWERGKRTIVRDVAKPPTQLFTAASVRNLKGKLQHPEPLHALRVTFIAASNGHEVTEIIVYADGYDASTATLFEAIEIPGKTNEVEVRNAARMLLRRREIRRETFTFEIDFSFLETSFGDRAHLEHFALRSTDSGWIEEVQVSNGSIVRVVLSDEVELTHGVAYQLHARRVSDGLLYLLDVDNPAAPGQAVVTDTLTLTDPLPVEDGPEEEDLFAFGPAGKITDDVTVIGIEPNGDDTATITCMPYSDELFADDGTYILLESGRVLLTEAGIPILLEG